MCIICDMEGFVSYEPAPEVNPDREDPGTGYKYNEETDDYETIMHLEVRESDETWKTRRTGRPENYGIHVQGF